MQTHLRTLMKPLTTLLAFASIRLTPPVAFAPDDGIDTALLSTTRAADLANRDWHGLRASASAASCKIAGLMHVRT